MPKQTSKKILLILIVALIVWFFRPFFHPIIMSFVISPLKAIAVLAIIAGIYMFFKSLGPLKIEKVNPSSYTIKPAKRVSGSLVTGYVVIIIVLFISLFLESEIRYTITSKKIDYTAKSNLPTFEPARLTPKQVAARYADDSFQNPQEHLGDSQIILVDGKLKRVFPRLPDGGLLYFINKLSGFVTVDVDTLDRKVSIEDQKFEYSEGVGIFDNLYYRLHLKKYFVTYTNEPIYLKDDAGKWVTVVPYMSYRGFPFTTPYWAGVMVAKSDGSIEDYTPEQAQQISYLKGNRIHPKEIVNFYTHSYSYKNGLLNKWFIHKNQIEIVNLPSDEQVIHVPTNEGFKQLVVAEPYGRSYGIYKIFLIDATTGDREIIEYDQNSQLTGPVAAADYIKREFPTYNWNSFSLSEPRPMKIGQDLYWMLSIIPNDAAGIAQTVLFNTKTNKVIGFKTEEEFKTIMQSGVLPEQTSVQTPEPTKTKDQEIKNKIDSIEKEVQDLKKLIGE